MILDRYYQFAALILAFLFFREDIGFAAMMLIPLVFLALPVVLGLLVWQELNGRVGASGPRNLVRLRWQLSRSPGIFGEKRRKKIARAVIKAYDLAPETALAEQATRLERLMQDAHAIDRRVPPIFQRPLTAEAIAKILAEAEGLSGPPRAALVAALVKAAPQKRQHGILAQARSAIRRALVPFAGSKLERDRITHVFFQVLTGGPATSNDRLVALAAAIRDAREKAGLEGRALTLTDPIIELPLGTQRELVLISRIAFGNDDMAKIALTDPSRIKRLRAIKDRMDTVSAPDRDLWDVTATSTATSTAAGTAAAATRPSSRHAEAASDASGPEQEPSEDALGTILENNAKEAILLARTWPISGQVPGRSWLGGTPLLPRSMPWPVLEASQAPLHFLTQIDCAELPRINGGEAMPDDGLLLFFGHISEDMLWEDDEGSAQVVYVPASEIPDSPASLPDQLSDIFGEPGRRVYPRWPVVPHATKSFFWDQGMPKAMHHLAQTAQDAAIAPFLPPASQRERNSLFEANPLRDPETGKMLRGEDGNPRHQFSLAPELLEAGFPFCGAAMSRFMAEYNAQIWQLIDRERSFKGYLERRLETTKNADQDQERIRKQEAKIAELSKTLDRLSKVSGRLTAVGDMDRVPDNEAKLFTEWLIQMKAMAHPAIDPALHRALKYLAQQAVTDPMMQKVLPQALFDFFDADLRPSPARSEHMMLGHTQIRTNSTSGPGLRLLALDSDGGLDFTFCDMGMAEFWIEPEDLERRDFSKVVAFTAGG